jgi:hypothetical protein
MTQHEAQTFLVRLRTEPGVDGIRSLRTLLKIALRRLGLRAIEAKEDSMSAYSEKIAKQKQSGLYRVSDFQNGSGQPREITHEIAYLAQDVQKFDREIDVLQFTDTFKQLQVNVTNGELLIEMLGDDPAAWPGNLVTLYLAPYGKEGKLGIRVKRPGADTPKPVAIVPSREQEMDDDIPF